MPDETTDFGSVDRIQPNAVGRPGQRTFRLLIHAEGELAMLWLEKEQLNALGEAIEQVLAQTGSRSATSELPSEQTDVAVSASLEFSIGQLAIGFDQEKARFLLIAHRREADLDGPPTFICQVTPSQARRLSREIEEVVNAGRPRCRFCNQPINPEGHVCPASNGHQATRFEN